MNPMLRIWTGSLIGNADLSARCCRWRGCHSFGGVNFVIDSDLSVNSYSHEIGICTTLQNSDDNNSYKVASVSSFRVEKLLFPIALGTVFVAFSTGSLGTEVSSVFVTF